MAQLKCKMLLVTLVWLVLKTDAQVPSPDVTASTTGDSTVFELRWNESEITNYTYAPPSNPTNVTLQYVTETTAQIQWPAQPAAIGYRVIVRLTDRTLHRDSNVTGTTFRVGGMASGETYDFSVYSWGFGDVIDYIVVHPLRVQTVPSPPDDVTVNKTGDTFFELRWSASVGAHIYHVYAEKLFKGVATGNITMAVNNTELSALVGGLEPGLEYRMSVRTEGYQGEVGKPSETFIDSTLAATPDKLHAVLVNMTMMTFALEPALGAQTYMVEMLPSDSEDPKMMRRRTFCDVSDVRIEFLIPGTWYSIVAKSVNAFGKVNGVGSPPLYEQSVPAAPQVGSFLDVTSSSMLFRWPEVFGAISYNVYVSSSDFDENTTDPYHAHYHSNDADMQVFGLRAGTIYGFQAQSIGHRNHTSSLGDIAYQPTTPFPPLNVREAGVTVSTITLNWDMAKGATAYLVRIDTPDETAAVKQMQIRVNNTLRAKVRGLEPGTWYNFYLSSIGIQGRVSYETKPLYDQTLPATPEQPILDGVTTTSIAMHWDDVKGAEYFKIKVVQLTPSNNSDWEVESVDPASRVIDLVPGAWYNMSVFSVGTRRRRNLVASPALTAQTDVDECALGSHRCHIEATCQNTNGSYTCKCEEWFVGDGFNCTDVDECELGSHRCHTEATCQNTKGSYTCKCGERFVGDGFNCTDVDECELGSHRCHTEATCQNTKGSYTCKCGERFVGDGFNCTDVDECALGSDRCHTEATCHNTNGSYTCKCGERFVGDGFNCTDVDECALGSDRCHTEATCHNTNGSYTCKCGERFVGDGFNCTDSDLLSGNGSPLTSTLKLLPQEIRCNFSGTDDSLNRCCEDLIKTERHYSPYFEPYSRSFNKTSLLREAFHFSKKFSTALIEGRYGIEKHEEKFNSTSGPPKAHLGKVSLDWAGVNCSGKSILSRFRLPKCILTLLTSAYKSKLHGRGGTYMLKSNHMASIDVLGEKNQLVSVPVEFSFNVANDKTFQEEVLPLYESQADGGRVLFTEVSWKCVFLTEESFSDEGCQWKKGGEKTKVRCQCDHTTAFSVLLAVETLTVPYHVKILSFVMEGVSIFFLLFTFFILISVRKQLHNDRTFVQINLSFSLCLFHSANIAHEVALYVPELCFPVAVTLQYFLLTSMFWMLIEGVTLAVKTSDKALHYSNMKSLKRNFLRVFTGWVIPAFITAAAAISGYLTDSYLALSKVQQLQLESSSYQHDRCWMDPASVTFLWSIAAPVGLVIFINFFILIRVACITIQLRRNVPAPSIPDPDDNGMKKAEEVRATLKLVLILLPVLGIPFLLGFFVGLGSPSFILASMYIHVIINGLQGLFVFVVYCVIDGVVMRCVTKELSKTFSSLGGD